MKDLIGNDLAVGDKVQVQLVAANIIGFIAQIEEASVLRINKGGKPGHIIVTCTVAIPEEPGMGAIAQVVKVYDAAKTAQQLAEKAVGMAN